MANREDVIKELKRRGVPIEVDSAGYSNIADAPVSRDGTIAGMGGRAIRMGVGGVADIAGLVADPIGDVIEYATGYEMSPSKEAALEVFDRATGRRFEPRNQSEEIAQTAGEFLTGGGAMAKIAKLTGAAPATVDALTMKTAPEAVGALTGGAAMEAAQQAELSPAATMGVSLAASMLPIGASSAGRKLLPKTAKDVVDAQLQAGGKVTAGGVLGGEVIPRIESGLAQAPLIGSPIRKARYSVAATLDDRLDEIADSVSSENLSQLDDAGQFIRRNISSSMSNKIGKVAAKYDEVFDKIPSDVLTPTPTSSNTLAAAKTQYQYNPRALAILDDPLLENLTSGQIPAKELKRMRPQIKELAERAKTKEGMGQLSSDIMKIYHGVNDDIKAVASQYVDNAEQSIAKIDSEFKAAMDLDGRLSKWMGSKADESLATSFKKLGGSGTAKTAGGANITALEDIAAALPKKDVKELSAYLLRTMGRNKEGVLNPVSFADEYMSMNKKARKIMFGKSLGAEKVNALEKIADYAQSSKTTLNPSGTAAQSLDITTMLGAGYGLMTSPQTLALASIPYLLSKGLSSQSLAKAINKLPRAALNKPVGGYTRMSLITTLKQAGANKNDAEAMADEIMRDKGAESNYNEKDLIRQELERRGITLDSSDSVVGGGGNIDSSPPERLGVSQQELAPQSALPENTKQNEGLRLTVYQDTPQNRAVGYGFNLDSGIAKNVWKRAGVQADFNDVYNGRAAITPQEAEALGRASFEIAAEDALDLFPDMLDYTPARQEAILDLSYQLGKPKLSEFKSTIAAAKKGQWTTAARNLLKSQYAKQVPNRAQRVARAFING